MPLFIIICGVLLLLLLVIVLKINTVISLIITAIAVGAAQGMKGDAILKSVEEGVGSTMGQLALILAFGAMLGKLIADGGGAQRITSGLSKAFGIKNLQWAMVLTGFLVGIPLFYNVGFVVLVPFVFMVCATSKLPLLYVGIPLLAALSVTHGYLPPHPGPTSIVMLYKADMGLTMFYGALVAIPAIIISGPLFARTLGDIKTHPPKNLFEAPIRPEADLPGFGISVFTGLFPVMLIALATIGDAWLPKGSVVLHTCHFLGNPVLALLLASLLAMYTMGIRQGKRLKDLLEPMEDALRSVTMILFIIGSAGAFKQVLTDSGVADYISVLTKDLPLSPLILVWAIAAVIRVALGSATVAALTTAGIAGPIIAATHVSPELMVLATGAGSLMFSHVNDPGFWMFKEYFGLSIRDTVRSWSVMETLVSVIGLLGVLLLNLFI
ncbi:gluconate permease GntT [bacterium A37T11]|nr:gluconate permease GntT [bacterium A37T11]